jgi:hypothetical protein
MFSLMFVFFSSRLKPTTLIKARNVSKLNLVHCQNIISKNSQKVDFSYIQLPFHTMPFHMLQTLGGMSRNFEKKNNMLIILQCCVIATCYNETTCAMTQWMATVKTRTTNILCLHSSILLVVKNTKK